MLPAELHRYFWEYEAGDLDEKADWYQIIERILEYGDTESNRWVYHTYSRAQIEDVVKKSRRLSKRTALLWQNLLEISKEEIVCLGISCQRGDIPFLDNWRKSHS